MELLDVTKHKMEKAVEKLDENLKTIRTGVANASLLEHVHFEYYGSETPINQVASIKVVEGRQLMIKPYDRSTLKDIERAIATSDTGLVPQSDGEVIRLNVPALTEERRKQLSKEADKMGEELTLEECFSGLEEIIEKMQDTEVSLEDSFALYEQGMKMLKNCNQKIDAVEKKMLKMNEQGELEEF